MTDSKQPKLGPETSKYLRQLGIERMFELLTWSIPPKAGETFDEYRARITRHDLIPDFLPRRTFYTLAIDLFWERYKAGEAGDE